jgi:hypothetical protein
LAGRLWMRSQTAIIPVFLWNHPGHSGLTSKEVDRVFDFLPRYRLLLFWFGLSFHFQWCTTNTSRVYHHHFLFILESCPLLSFSIFDQNVCIVNTELGFPSKLMTWHSYKNAEPDVHYHTQGYKGLPYRLIVCNLRSVT